MNNDNDLVPLEINLNAKAEGTLNESWLAMFGGAIETIMAGMFGGSIVPVSVTGTKKQISAFQKALGHEAKYLKAMKKHGLDNPASHKTKSSLDKSIKSFERDTGIVWPFK
jgi:hypothetical protein